MIEPFIHFVWIDKNDVNVEGAPKKYHSSLEKWQNMNPEMNVIVWSYNDIILLLKENFPDKTLEFFNSVRDVISRCDFIRFVIVYVYGGMYVDLDFHCLRPLYPFLRNRDVLLIDEPHEHFRDEHPREIVFNGIFAFRKRHPFVKEWINTMMENIEKSPNKNDVNVLKTTGPWALGKCYYSKPRDFPLEDYCLFTPYWSVPVDKDWDRRSKMCSHEEKPFTYTLWTEGLGWGGKFHEKEENKSVEYWRQEKHESPSLSHKKWFKCAFVLSCLLLILVWILFLNFKNKNKRRQRKQK